MILASRSLGWAWRGYSKRHSDSPEPGMQGLYRFISNQSVKCEGGGEGEIGRAGETLGEFFQVESKILHSSRALNCTAGP